MIIVARCLIHSLCEALKWATKFSVICDRMIQVALPGNVPVREIVWIAVKISSDEQFWINTEKANKHSSERIHESEDAEKTTKLSNLAYSDIVCIKRSCEKGTGIIFCLTIQRDSFDYSKCDKVKQFHFPHKSEIILSSQISRISL